MKKLKTTHNAFRISLLGGFHNLNGYVPHAPPLKGADVDGKVPASLYMRLDLHTLSSCVGWIILNTPGASGGPAREDA